jgi:ATP-dependent DNA helicase RecQ
VNRAPAEHLYFNTLIYNTRKQLYVQRIAAMVDNIEQTNICRSKFISAYFDDNTVKDCGICDNCFTKKQLELSTIEFTNIQEKF